MLCHILIFFSPQREFIFIFWLCRSACRILVPRPGIEPTPPCAGSTESSALGHQGSPHILIFIDKKTEVQRSEVACPRLHAGEWQGPQPGSEAGILNCSLKPGAGGGKASAFQGEGNRVQVREFCLASLPPSLEVSE